MDLEQGFQLGDIRVEPRNGQILRDGERLDVEPKVLALLCLLARTPGEAVSKADIFAAIWPEVTVSDDSLSRTVWKLRQALGDDARNPALVATVPKIGYRLLVTPASIAAASPSEPSSGRLQIITAAIAVAILAGSGFLMLLNGSGPETETDPGLDAQIARADEFYYQLTEAENAAAMRLYQQALATDPASAPALAGLANTITQQVVRWSPGQWEEVGLRSRIRTALANGRTRTPGAIEQLGRARDHAEAAVAADPDYALAYRALGLVQSAQGEIDLAMESYTRAVTIDPDAWEVFINLSDMNRHRGQEDLALAHMELAFEAMSRVYESQTVQIRPWYSGTGLDIAASHAARGNPAEAERWYRRVLQWDPLNPDALTGVAVILRARGDMAGVRETCAPLIDDGERETCLQAE